MARPGVDALASSTRSALDQPSSEGDSRLLAAHLLERTLLRLGRAGTLVDRRLSPCLQRMHSLRLYRLLGYVRLADYLTERLGMSLRRCQSILRLGRALECLPRLGRALEAGEVSFSKVEIVAAAAVSETEEIWLERAKRLTVARLREMVREGLASDAEPGSSPAIEQEAPGRLISFDAPAPVFAMWHWCLDLIRRIAGEQEPAWRCAEYLAAEFLSGVPDMQGGPPARESSAAEGRPGSESHSRRPTEPRPGRSPEAGGVGTAAWDEACVAVREALASIGPAADVDTILSDAAEIGGIDELDAWNLDARLRRLVRLRQSLSWRQGRLLAALASLRLHRELGFDTLDDWVTDRLSMSPRRARYLVSLDRRLRDLPLLADAYRRGLVSWCQARLLVRVVHPIMQSRWIRYARQVTVRRLEDVVIACEVEVARSAETSRASSPAIDAAPGMNAAAHTGATDVNPPSHIGAPDSNPPAHVGAPELNPAAHVGAPEVKPAAHVGAPGLNPPAHLGAPARPGAPPLPPAEPAPAADAATAPDSGSLHTSAPGNLLPERHASLVHSSAPRDLLSEQNASLLHTSAHSPAQAIAGVAVGDGLIRRRIAFWAPLDVAALWDSALRACRAAADRRLDDWECFLVLVRALRDTWENPEDPHWRRRHRILERDGWRCMAPGCSSRSGLNEHHIIFRSQQGDDDEGNLVTLCIGHHQQGIHEGRISCIGRAPRALWWDLGRRPGGDPLVRYFGERVVTRRPHDPSRPDARPAPPTLAVAR